MVQNEIPKVEFSKTEFLQDLERKIAADIPAEELKAYIKKTLPVVDYTQLSELYDPTFGDERLCICGHTYYRHFDPSEKMCPTLCKYCGCGNFQLAPES